MANRVVIMYAGKIVEKGGVIEVFKNPGHPYTRLLLSCIPKIDGDEEELEIIKGVVPHPKDFSKGCRFHNRCPYAKPVCEAEEPGFLEGEGTLYTCHFSRDELSEKNTIKKEKRYRAHCQNKTNETILEISNLKKYYPVTGGIFSTVKGYVRAVDNVNMCVKKGETFGLVGESGCGKSSMGRSILRLHDITGGSVKFKGIDVHSLRRKELQAIRKKMQIVFQDPYRSLNPILSAGKIIAEPMEIHGFGTSSKIDQRVEFLLESVGLRSGDKSRFPHEFSGGQRQRIGIARALALNPELIICDEPVSALDVSIQSQILNLLKKLQGEFGLTYIFIAHGLHVVKYISDRVGVMYLGKLVETGPVDLLFKSPKHPYTKALLSSIPHPDPSKKNDRIILTGDVPNPFAPPSGCRFHTRCRYVMNRCIKEEPRLMRVDDGRDVACFHDF